MSEKSKALIALEALEEERKKKYSNAELQRALDVSDTMISQWRSGKYKGDVPKLESKVLGFLTMEKARLEKVQEEPVALVPTSALQSCLSVINYCHEEQEMGLIVGGAGMGKTSAVNHYLKTYPTVLFLEVDTTWTKIAVLRKLHKALGGEETLSPQRMMEQVVSRLKGSKRLIIVDEAEYLNTHSLELLRRIHDFAKVGVVLVGLPRLLHNLRGRKGELRQIYSRLGIKAELGESLELSDIQLMLQKLLPEMTPLAPEVLEKTRGVTRHVAKLTRLTSKIAEAVKENVSANHLREASEMLVV